MPMRRGLCLLLFLAQCSAQNRLFVGKVQPAAGTCDPPSRATLVIRDASVQFAPSSGVIVLSGTASRDGQVQASLSETDSDKRPYQLTLQAKVAGNFLDGAYITKGCRYDVHLITAR